MFRNYFYILRSINELDKLLKFYTITEIYTQEKNTLFLTLHNQNSNRLHLIISVDTQFPYIILKDKHSKAKKNVVTFINELLPANILSISLAVGDRIVRIHTTNFNIYFSIKGSNTNVYFEDENKISFFKKTKAKIEESFSKLLFQNTLSFSNLKSTTQLYQNVNELKSAYPMISKEIKDELLFRQDYLNSRDLFYIFQKIIDEILNEPIAVFFSKELQKTVFYPSSFKSIKIENEEIFNDYNSALNNFLTNYYKGKSILSLKKDLDIFFEKELSNLSVKLNALSNRIKEGSKENLYFEFANILLSNKNKIKKGMDLIELCPLQSDTKYKIKLDTKLTPQQNINKYFEKAKDEKINFNKSKELFNLNKIKYDNTLKQKMIYENSDNFDIINKLHSDLIKKNDNKIKMNTGENFRYWHYLIDDKFHVYIGRDSKSNDYLSIKFAKQNDYWFHARGLAGSHTVLRINSPKEIIPKEIIKKAASLAAFYSKAKSAKLASVSYTFAKFVHKKKGMEPGKVLLIKENTILVKPYIPESCELLNE